MRLEIEHRPAYALAVAYLEPGESVVAEGGAMVSMDDHVKVETRAGNKDDGMLKGLWKGIKRAVVSESFFQNTFTAEGRPGHVTLAPQYPGDVATYPMMGQTFYLQSTAFLCSAPSVEIDVSWGGAKTFFGGEGLLLIKATGQGPIAFNAFGGVKPVTVDGEFIVDTGHIVAFEGTLTFSISRFGRSWKSFFFGGEGLVCTFKGHGTVFLQTRNPVEFGRLLGPLLPPREG